MQTINFANKINTKLEPRLENGFFSPFSIQLALGMCTAGAKGDTFKCMSELLEVPLDLNEQYDFFQSLVKEVNDQEGCELATANALWTQAGFTFNVNYLADIKQYFDGTISQVDYINSAEQAVHTINNWCDTNTHGKIPSIITRDSINDDTRLILTNAIYFKGKWEVQFDKSQTTQKNFYKTPSEPKKVSMMSLESSFDYYENDYFQALDLPYQGDTLSMLVLLPKLDSATTTNVIEDHLASYYEESVNGLREHKVYTHLPRFKMETHYKLSDALKELGAELAFSDDADFSGMTEEDNFKISEVIHKAFVQCDEEGTEAAAATAVMAIRCTGVSQPKLPKVFNADHPFVFFIRNRVTNTVLFYGRVIDPQ